MQLPQKQKAFSESAFSFLKYTLSFGIFSKKMTLLADVFPKLRTPKNLVNKISKKSPFHSTLREATCNGDETLLKSERHHLYQVY